MAIERMRDTECSGCGRTIRIPQGMIGTCGKCDKAERKAAKHDNKMIDKAEKEIKAEEKRMEKNRKKGKKYCCECGRTRGLTTQRSYEDFDIRYLCKTCKANTKTREEMIANLKKRGKW